MKESIELVKEDSFSARHRFKRPRLDDSKRKTTILNGTKTSFVQAFSSFFKTSQRLMSGQLCSLGLLITVNSSFIEIWILHQGILDSLKQSVRPSIQSIINGNFTTDKLKTKIPNLPKSYFFTIFLNYIFFSLPSMIPRTIRQEWTRKRKSPTREREKEENPSMTVAAHNRWVKWCS